MRSVRHLIIGAATLALTLTAIGAPVSAAGSGKVAIINGVPFKRIDVCVNGREIKSALPYGKQVFRKLKAGPKKIKFYKKDPRTCRGKRLATKSFPFPAGSDLTIVMTKSGPKVLIFDNAALIAPPLPTDNVSLAWRNASDIAAVSLDRDFDVPTPTPITPAVDPVWLKADVGESWGPLQADVAIYTVVWTVVDTATVLAGPVATLISRGFRYEWIFIGTTPSNARMVVLKRPL